MTRIGRTRATSSWPPSTPPPRRLRARAAGLAERRGHTEAAVELMSLCGLSPVAVISEVCNDDGSVARLPQLRTFADQHFLKVVSIEQVAAFAPLPTAAV
ncbi:MAG TPA: 3,4-dihydroxy-2-butanone-4-phosphate synthase [Pseudonocardiaceae bacterium]|nr:3,4-dihydroxy-2-butanone-4-phosphate synthase [Pseudonocardiaceae bacterium]